MIDLQEFQLPEDVGSQMNVEVSDASHSPQNLCHLTVPQITQHSLHGQAPIAPLDEGLSCFEHSANLLDQFEHREEEEWGQVEADRSTELDQERQRRRIQRRLKNQTKNIPKNFGKGIISFIEKHPGMVRGVVEHNGLNFTRFMERIRGEKKVINTIADLRRLWTDEEMGRSMRVISNHFFRRYSLHYIFNSRISNYDCHIKYRLSLWWALENPQRFNHIKEY